MSGRLIARLGARWRADQRGITLPTVLVLMMLTSIIMATVLFTSSTGVLTVSRAASRERDTRAGQAGIDQTIQILNDWDVGDPASISYPTLAAQRELCQNSNPLTADPTNPSNYYFVIDHRAVRVECTPFASVGLIRRFELNAYVAAVPSGSGTVASGDWRRVGRVKARILDINFLDPNTNNRGRPSPVGSRVYIENRWSCTGLATSDCTPAF
ncbi:MAG: hypothetical protein V9E99_04680 [Microthrixaceae bacterium]